MADRVLYMIEDVEHNRLPLFVGTIEEMVAFTGKPREVILSAITHARQRGGNSQYIRLGTESEIDQLED